MRKYSHSAFKTFQRCAKKWSYLYIDRIVPKESPIYMQRGVTLHEHLAAMYDPSGLLDYPELSDNDHDLLVRYTSKWDDKDWKVVSVEEDYEFNVYGYKRPVRRHPVSPS